MGPGTCLILLGALFWPGLWSQNPKILVLGPNLANLWIFLISWIFGIPIFRTLFEKIDPTWLLRANGYVEKNPIWILFISGFHQKVSKMLVFTNQIPLFHDNPVFSVRPSETSSGRFLCFQSDSYFFKSYWKNQIFYLEPFSSSTCPIDSQTRLERCALKRSYDENHFKVLLLG